MISRHSRIAAAALFSLAATVAGFAEDRVLSAVPANSVSVGVVHLDRARNSTLGQRLFDETNKASFDGEGEKFLRDAGLSLGKDIDTLAFSIAPSDGTDGEMLVAVEGRFDVNRLSSAVTTRGAVAKDFAGKRYFLLPKGEHPDGDSPTVSFYDRGLVLIGQENAVKGAITRLANGGSHFRDASGLASDLSRVPSDAVCWMVADVQRAARFAGAPKPEMAKGGEAMTTALKHVSSVSAWTTERGDDLAFGATAVSSDAETRDNLADMLRGATAAWRMAVQEKQPALVDVIRKFKVDQSGNTVSFGGTVPVQMIQDFAHAKQNIASK